MRKTFYSLLAAFSLVACSENPLEQQSQLYCAAIEKADTISSISAVVEHCLSTRTEDIRILEQYKSGGGEELQERFGDEYASLLSGVECLRDSFCTIMDSKFVACKMHFVEKRTVLYGMAAEFYANAQYLEELEAVKTVAADYSAKAYVCGQRLCDPPANIIAAYDSVKSLAAECYASAVERLSK